MWLTIFWSTSVFLPTHSNPLCTCVWCSFSHSFSLLPQLRLSNGPCFYIGQHSKQWRPKSSVPVFSVYTGQASILVLTFVFVRKNAFSALYTHNAFVHRDLILAWSQAEFDAKAIFQNILILILIERGRPTLSFEVEGPSLVFSFYFSQCPASM